MPKQKANLTSLWWILIALGVVILLLTVLVVSLLLYQRHRAKQLEALAAERRAMLKFRRDQAVNKQRADKRRVQEKQTVKDAPVEKKTALIFANDANSTEDSFGAWEAGADEWVVDARRCGRPFGVVQCDRRRTLLALYSELTSLALARRDGSDPKAVVREMLPEKLKDPLLAMRSIAELLNQLYKENGKKAIENISPHSILVSTKGSLALVLKKDMKLQPSATGVDDAVDGAFENMRWDAPELRLDEGISPASDMFSFALVMYQLAHPMHEIPFPELDAQSASTRIATQYRPPTVDILELNVPYDIHEIVNLIKRGWAQDAEERPTIDEALTTLSSFSTAEPAGERTGDANWDKDVDPTNPAPSQQATKWDPKMMGAAKKAAPSISSYSAPTDASPAPSPPAAAVPDNAPLLEKGQSKEKGKGDDSDSDSDSDSESEGESIKKPSAAPPKPPAVPSKGASKQGEGDSDSGSDSDD